MPSVAAMEISNSNGEESKEGVLYDAQRLYDLGCGALRIDAYDEAADCLSKALEIRVQHYGELALECAMTYYKYGCALFDKLQLEADPLGDTATPQEKEDPADDEEGDGDGEGDQGDEEEVEDGNLEDAWKMLEFARVIHEKHGCCTIETVDIITKLADINCFKEDYKTCFEDYANALHILEGLVEPDSRILAELHFKIALAHQLDLKPKEALGYCNHAVAICEARVQRLKEELAEAKMVALDVEIKEIEESLVDLREKADELKEMATAPSLVEALQAANPEAVASLKQIMAVVSQASGSSNGGVDAPSTSATFDKPSLGRASSSTAVTHLGNMGRGVKRAVPVLVSTDEISRAAAPQPKKRSLDDMMMGSGFGETQIGFGDTPERVTNGGNLQNGHQSVVASVVQGDSNLANSASKDQESTVIFHPVEQSQL
ncbi:unnamed protein product [Sphagnum compactum]